MGGPMWWARLMGRNGLEGLDYGTKTFMSDLQRSYVAGELHRMERDYLARAPALARVCGMTEEQAERALRAFFTLPEPDCLACETLAGPWRGGRCHRHDFIFGDEPLKIIEDLGAANDERKETPSEQG